MSNRDELNRRAELVGVKLDARKSDQTLQEEVTRAEEAKGLTRRATEAEKGDEGVLPPKDQGFAATRTSHLKVILKNGYFPEDGSEKVPAGAMAELRVGEARRLINEGKAEIAPEVLDRLAGLEEGVSPAAKAEERQASNAKGKAA